jgi:hypothetical protein
MEILPQQDERIQPQQFEQDESLHFETVATSADIIGTDYESHCIHVDD